MFFYVSKLFWLLLQPSSLVALCLLRGVWLLRRARSEAGRRWLVAGTALYLIGGFSPLGHWLTIPLENRFARPALASLGDDIAGIIVLGGAQDTLVATGRNLGALTDAAERMTEPVALLRALPGRPLLFSGGGQLLFDNLSEAEVAKRFYVDLGVDPARLWLEERSRDTYQNAAFSAALLRDKGEAGKRWLLVTSAYHMPRAVGCFRRAGIDVVAWPVDYRTRGWSDLWRPFGRPSEGLRRLDEVAREWVGLLAYRLTGRTDRLLPGDTDT